MRVARAGPRHTSVLAGPTCDSFDVLYENIPLPRLQLGDILLFEAMGAYTNASASTFNGYEKAKIVMVE
jgi:ornithine decarboxylase